VEWGAADGMVSSSHSQSYPAIVVDALAVVADHLGALVAGAGRGRRRRCDAMRAADVCDAVLETAVLPATADVLDAAAVADMTVELDTAPGMQRRAVSS
jgi:hypothetical protein